MSDDLERDKAFFEALYPLLKGNRDALMLAADLIYTGHLWDDLIDKDKPRTDAEINYAFEAMVGRIPNNQFYQQNIRHLAPLMMSTILQWKDANKLESNGSSPNEKAAAYMLRNMLLQVVSFCIWLVGGDEWYEQAGVEFQRLCASDLRTLYATFQEELNHA